MAAKKLSVDELKPYAIAAMQSLVVARSGKGRDRGNNFEAFIAEDAFALADAMLAEEQKRRDAMPKKKAGFIA
jgi:hypothetical protein